MGSLYNDCREPATPQAHGAGGVLTELKLVVVRCDSQGICTWPSFHARQNRGAGVPVFLGVAAASSEAKFACCTALVRYASHNHSTARLPPQPDALETPLAASVTSFRHYIACPYRFYLRHVAKLGTITDGADELDGGGFGGLVHLVLEQMAGRKKPRVRVARGIRKESQNICRTNSPRSPTRRFGKGVGAAAVLLQVEQIRLRRRLPSGRRGRNWEGWRIVFSEIRQSGGRWKQVAGG